MISPHFVDDAVQEYLSDTSEFVGDPDVAQCFAAGAVLALQHHVPDVRSVQIALKILLTVSGEYRDCESFESIERFSASLKSILNEEYQTEQIERLHDRVTQPLCPGGPHPTDPSEVPNLEDDALRSLEEITADGFDPVMQVDPVRNRVTFRHLPVPRPDLPRGMNREKIW